MKKEVLIVSIIIGHWDEVKYKSIFICIDWVVEVLYWLNKGLIDSYNTTQQVL